MASWSEVEQQAPELAAAAKAYFDKHKHKTLATLRKDGSPRISGSEMEIADGELTFGSMWRGVKALDLLRDPRFALHSGSDEPDDGWTGDAKVAGRAEEVAEDGGQVAHLPGRHHRARRRAPGRAGGPHRHRVVARGTGHHNAAPGLIGRDAEIARLSRARRRAELARMMAVKPSTDG
jgi:hypothetical protein